MATASSRATPRPGPPSYPSPARRPAGAIVAEALGLGGDYNLRRLERYLVMARESGAQPIVALNEADLCADPEGMQAAVVAVALGAPVLVIAALTDDLEDLRAELAPGETVALVGSSGAGKSTLINRLAGSELLRTGPGRESGEPGV